jgi:hypothetical protein
MWKSETSNLLFQIRGICGGYPGDCCGEYSRVNTLLAVFNTAGMYDIILATPVVDMVVVAEPMVPHFVLGH